MMPKAIRSKIAQNKKGAMKLKSAPRFAAANVNAVRPTVTTRVRPAASNTASPAKEKLILVSIHIVC